MRATRSNALAFSRDVPPNFIIVGIMTVINETLLKLKKGGEVLCAPSPEK